MPRHIHFVGLFAVSLGKALLDKLTAGAVFPVFVPALGLDALDRQITPGQTPLSAQGVPMVSAAR